MMLESLGEHIYLGLYIRHGMDPRTAPAISPKAARWLAIFVTVVYATGIVFLLFGC